MFSPGLLVDLIRCGDICDCNCRGSEKQFLAKKAEKTFPTINQDDSSGGACLSLQQEHRPDSLNARMFEGQLQVEMFAHESFKLVHRG